jgi:hypothetical protein
MRDSAVTTATARDGWVLERHAHGRLAFVSAAGQRHDAVDVLRAFPITDPAGPVAVVAGDGAELAWIPALAEVPPALRSMLEAELAQREFLPRIERIEAVSDGEPAEWKVVTDRGPQRVKVAAVDDITSDEAGGAFVTDTFGVRYRITSVAALDARSRRLFEKMF